MSRIRPILVAGMLLGVVSLTGCTMPSPGCDLTIAVLDDNVPPLDPADITVPADAEILVRPGDVDPDGWALTEDANGGPQVELLLRPEAAERFAQHTRDHIGGSIALVVNGVVVSAPVVNSPIEDGRLQISFAGEDPQIADGLRSCLPVELRPPT